MLSKREILLELASNNIVIQPFCREHVQPNSYDVTLGNWFIHMYAAGGLPRYDKLEYVPDDEPVYIRSGHTTLAMTREIVGCTGNIVPEMHSRSSWRRKGLTACDDAGFGDRGYVNHWTVELSAHHGDEPVIVCPGDRFAQISFDYTGNDDARYAGQYNARDWPLCMIPSEYRDEYRDQYSYLVEMAANHPDMRWVCGDGDSREFGK